MNNDGIEAPNDALAIVNYISANGASCEPTGSPFDLDVSGDGCVSPIDALLIYNWLNPVPGHPQPPVHTDGLQGGGTNIGTPLVRLRLTTTNTSGSPISSIAAGGSFLLQATVEDLRPASPDARGVFASYVDVTYDASKVIVNGAVTRGPSFPAMVHGSISAAGLLDEVGSATFFDPLGLGEFLLFSVPMQATSAGTVDFDALPPGLEPMHYTLVFGSDDPAPVDFLGTSLIVTGGANQAPVAIDDSGATYTTPEDTDLVVAAPGILANDSDPDGHGLTAQIVSQPSHGTLVSSPGGGFTYTPADNYFGPDSFTYRASDGQASDSLSNIATVAITVTSINDNPTITSNGGGVSAAVSVVENQTAVTTVISTDVDGGPPLYAIVGGVDAAHFAVNVNSGVLTFQAAPNFDSPTDANADNVYEVTVEVSDGAGGIDTQHLSISVTNNDRDVNNDAVVAPNDVVAIVNYISSNGASCDPTGSPFDLDVSGDGCVSPIDALLIYNWLNPQAPGHPQPPVHTDGMQGGGTNIGTPLVRLRLTTTNTSGSPISSIAAGGSFLLQATVEDLRPASPDARGVFASYVDVTYDASKVVVNGAATRGPSFPAMVHGSISAAGLLDEVGSASFFDPLGLGQFLLFSVPMQATSAGTVDFDALPPGLEPMHYTLVFGSDDPAPVDFLGTSLIVTNRAPVLAAIGNKLVNEQATLSFTATATDPDQPGGQTLTFSLDAAAVALGMSIDASTGAFNWTPTESQGGGEYFVTITVTDNGTNPASLTDQETIKITVGEVNASPVLGAIGDKLIDEQATLSFTATAADQDQPAQTWTFNLDAAAVALGMSIDASSGAFSWTPTESQGGAEYFVTITVTDNGTSPASLTDQETIKVTVHEVNAAPVLGAIGNKLVNEQAGLSFTAAATDQDQPGQSLNYSLDAAAIALGMSIDASSGAFSWTPTESQGGAEYSVTITVTDNGTNPVNLSDEETIEITVNEVNVAPVLGAIGDKLVDEHTTLSFTAVATDQDLPGQSLTFSLDGAALALGMSIDLNTGAFNWTPTESQGGSDYFVTITVTDNGTNPANLTDEQTIQITVSEVDDGDGIDDDVDTDPANFSNDFSDMDNGGATTGTITTRGDQTLTVVDAVSPDGLTISAAPGGGSTPAAVDVDGTTFFLDAGDSVTVTHGSVILHVESGVVEATFKSESGQVVATASLSPGPALTFEPDTVTFAVAPTTSEATTVEVVLIGQNGQQATATLSSGDEIIFEPEIFSVAAPPTNDQPVTIVVSTGEVITANPGATAHASALTFNIAPESLNLDSNGVFTLYIFGAADFAAANIDVSTVRFHGAAATQSALLDANHDGLLDLQLKFRRQDTALLALYEELLIADHDADGVLDATHQVASVNITGQTLDDHLFTGSDNLTLFLSGRSLRELLEELFD